MFRRWLLGILAVVAIAIVGLFVIAWRPSIAPDASVRGAILAAVARLRNCRLRRWRRPGVPVCANP